MFLKRWGTNVTDQAALFESLNALLTQGPTIAALAKALLASPNLGSTRFLLPHQQLGTANVESVVVRTLMEHEGVEIRTRTKEQGIGGGFAAVDEAVTRIRRGGAVGASAVLFAGLPWANCTCRVAIAGDCELEICWWHAKGRHTERCTVELRGSSPLDAQLGRPFVSESRTERQIIELYASS